MGEDRVRLQREECQRATGGRKGGSRKLGRGLELLKSRGASKGLISRARRCKRENRLQVEKGRVELLSGGGKWHKREQIQDFAQCARKYRKVSITVVACTAVRSMRFLGPTWAGGLSGQETATRWVDHWEGGQKKKHRDGGQTKLYVRRAKMWSGGNAKGSITTHEERSGYEKRN